MRKFASVFVLNNEKGLFLIAFLLVIPALFLNLGITPLLADEPTRALVALEMLFSDNFITPTINGEYYYNKPPLYNWILVLLYKLSGTTNEFVVRLPTVLGILLFSWVMYFSLKKFVTTNTTLVTILFYITCGRILFYDSLLGLIDTLFSVVIFMNFIILYYYEQKNKLFLLFILSYLCITIGFFFKGLPALVFQGLTLIAFFGFRKRLPAIFSWQHVVGISVFVLFLRAYYSQYLKFNTLGILLNTLVTESTKRTVVEKSIWESFLHVLSFPFETVGHFLPWTLPLFFLLVKRFRVYIQSNDFLSFVLLMFMINIVVYWLSPETRPRYLFMFLPLIFLISAEAILFFKQSMYTRVLEYFIGVIICLCVVVVSGLLFFPKFVEVSYYYSKLLTLSVMLFLLGVFYFYNVDKRIVLIVIFLLTLRIAFNWFILPYRLVHDPFYAYSQSAIKVGKITKGFPLKIDRYTPINHGTSYYISRERGDLLTQTFEPLQPKVFYLTDIIDDKFKIAEIIFSFTIEYNNTKIYLVKLP